MAIDTNKKLELIRSIRMNQLNNRVVLNNREQFLYGTAKPLSSKSLNNSRGELYSLEAAAIDGMMPEPAASAAAGPLRSFKIRLVIAVILFGAFIFYDRTGQNVMGITSQIISEAISTESQELFDFINNIFEKPPQ